MTVLTDLERPPLHHHVPAHVGSYGPEVADLAAAVGMTLDPEQRLLPDAAYAYDDTGRLVATEVGCSAPRQNIKTHAGKACSLADLALFHEPDCLWTAHLRSTSDDAFRNATGTGLADLFDNYDFLRRLVDTITDSDGEKSIVLRPRAAGLPKATLKFVTRGVGGGRGLTGRRITHDEALFLKPSMVAAMTSILSAQSMSGQAQVRYLGSPGILQSQVWREVRDLGRSGTAEAMAWLEWAAERRPCGTEQCSHVVGSIDCALDDPALIRQANLAVDRRIHIRFVLDTERLRLSPTAFMAERMGWWEDPPNSTGGDLDVARWMTLVDLGVKRGKQLVYGVDVGEDRSTHTGVAWYRPDGDVQVMLAEPDGKDQRRVSAMAAPDRIRELVANYGGQVMLGGPAAALEQDLTGIRTQLVSSADFATACGRLEDLLRAGRIHHQDQPELNDAIAAARWRSVGTSGERAWRLKDAAGIGPLAAVTRALYGLLFTETTPPPAPRAVTSNEAGGIGAMEF